MARAVLVRWAVLTAVVAAAACTAPSLQRDAVREAPAAGPYLDVHNMGWGDVRILVVRNGFARRMGTVTHMTRRSFALPRDLIGRSGVRLRIDPVGSTDTHLTDPVFVGRDQRVEVTVHTPLAFTVVAVRPGGATRAGAGRGR